MKRDPGFKVSIKATFCNTAAALISALRIAIGFSRLPRLFLSVRCQYREFFGRVPVSRFSREKS